MQLKSIYRLYSQHVVFYSETLRLNQWYAGCLQLPPSLTHLLDPPRIAKVPISIRNGSPGSESNLSTFANAQYSVFLVIYISACLWDCPEQKPLRATVTGKSNRFMSHSHFRKGTRFTLVSSCPNGCFLFSFTPPFDSGRRMTRNK